MIGVHGGTFQALLTGGSVVLGVVLAEWLRAVNRRRQNVRDAVRELTMLIPHVALGFVTGSGVDTDYGSVWFGREERVRALLHIVRREWRWPLRRLRRVHAAADDLLARMAAAALDLSLKGKRVPPSAIEELQTAELTTAVFGEGTPLDQAIGHYRRHGIDAPKPR
jgi:hypothetical protein